MRWLLAAIIVAITFCAGCASGRSTTLQPVENGQQGKEPSAGPPKCLEYHSKWRGRGTPRELSMLQDMTNEELSEFLKNIEAEPWLRVEAVRLLVERTEDRKKLFPVFLTCLKGLTKREREAILYYLSRLGAPEHIPAIEASMEGMDEHYQYSAKCTVNQIRERTKEGE